MGMISTPCTEPGSLEAIYLGRCWVCQLETQLWRWVCPFPHSSHVLRKKNDAKLSHDKMHWGLGRRRFWGCIRGRLHQGNKAELKKSTQCCSCCCFMWRSMLISQKEVICWSGPVINSGISRRNTRDYGRQDSLIWDGICESPMAKRKGDKFIQTERHLARCQRSLHTKLWTQRANKSWEKMGVFSACRWLWLRI